MQSTINKMLAICLLSLLLLPSSYARGRVAGDLNCYYEIISKHSWPTGVKTEQFSMDITKTSFISTDSEVLDRTIRMRYVPGYSNNKLTHFVFSLTYDGIHAGADLPINEGAITIKIGSDSSDMIGGFLHCTPKLK
jgi:hypothetical protein